MIYTYKPIICQTYIEIDICMDGICVYIYTHTYIYMYMFTWYADVYLVQQRWGLVSAALALLYTEV